MHTSKLLLGLMAIGGAALAEPGKVVTGPVSVQVQGLYKTSGLSVALRSAIAPSLEEAVRKICGQRFHILDLDTRVKFEQPVGVSTATYRIEGTVTCLQQE